MNWRDFFYFSKGERRGLTLLFCLLTILWVVQSVSKAFSEDNKQKKEVVIDTIKGSSLPVAMQMEKKKEYKKQFYSPQKKKNSSRVSNKYKVGTVVELNTADTSSLKKVPGIGTVFSQRIIKYKNLLGGYYTVVQLKEVYGMDEEKYQSLKNWFYVDTTYIQKLHVNDSDYFHLYRHPYLNKEQTKAILNLRKQKSRLTGWENLLLLNEFSTKDIDRLRHYLSFD